MRLSSFCVVSRDGRSHHFVERQRLHRKNNGAIQRLCAAPRNGKDQRTFFRTVLGFTSSFSVDDAAEITQTVSGEKKHNVGALGFVSTASVTVHPSRRALWEQTAQTFTRRIAVINLYRDGRLLVIVVTVVIPTLHWRSEMTEKLGEI